MAENLTEGRSKSLHRTHPGGEVSLHFEFFLLGSVMFAVCVGFCRKISRYCESYLRNMASTMLVNLEKTVNVQEEKFTNFEVGMLV